MKAPTCGSFVGRRFRHRSQHLKGSAMSTWVPIIASSQVAVIAAGEVDFGTAMERTPAGNVAYEFVSTTNCWIKQGTAPVAASAAAGSMYVPAGRVVMLDPRDGVNLSVIQASAGGTGVLTKMRRIGG